jgi:uridylate kinase
MKFGHSIVAYPPKVESYRAAAQLLASLSEKGHKIVVVVGGGPQAREYIQAAKALGCDGAFRDLIGIETTRLNARLLIAALGEKSYPTPATSVEELKNAVLSHNIVVMGGLTPGHSTDAVTAIASEVLGADLFIKSMEVGGIYDSDPTKEPSAKLRERITYDELLKVVLQRSSTEAGDYSPLDLVALEILRRSKARVVFVGPRVEDILKAVNGEKVGTLVCH